MHAVSTPVAASVSRLGSESAFDVLARARALEEMGHEIVHLEIGEPSFDTPEHIKRAAIAAIEANVTHYTPVVGIPRLRDRIADYAARFRGVAPFAREAVIVSAGVKPLVWNTLSCILERGDEVVYTDPVYNAYASCASWLGAVGVPVPVLEANDFRFDLDALRAAVGPKTKAIIINSPQNPTGGVLERSDLEAIAELAMRFDAYVLADEIYCRDVYDVPHHSIVALDGMRERTILFDGFSKSYAMTGWRLGYGIMPAAVARAVALLNNNSTSCVNAFVQEAGIAALEGPDEPVQAMVAELRRRRDLITAGLNSLPGIRCRTPRGAFYAFPNVTGVTNDDRKLAEFFLEEAHVAALGGSSFGEGGRGFMRFSYATPTEQIARAIDRMREALPRFV